MESSSSNLEGTDDLIPSLQVRSSTESAERIHSIIHSHSNFGSQLGEGFDHELLEEVHSLIDTQPSKPLTWI